MALRHGVRAGTALRPPVQALSRWDPLRSLTWGLFQPGPQILPLPRVSCAVPSPHKAF